MLPTDSGNNNMTAPQTQLTVDQFLKRVSDEFEGLSKQLKQIARHVEAHRDHLGLEGIQDVAAQCEVQPSAVVRFAKHFGFSGYSELQRIFRDGLSQQIAPNRNYQSRIREVMDAAQGPLSSAQIAREFLAGSIAGMQELQTGLDDALFKTAVDLLEQAQTIWIAGSRRSFPVAAYLDYALQHTDKRICLVNALGSMHEGQVRSVRPGDVLIAVSFAPYAEETLLVAQQAAQRGADLIAITDSRMSPLACRTAPPSAFARSRPPWAWRRACSSRWPTGWSCLTGRPRSWSTGAPRRAERCCCPSFSLPGRRRAPGSRRRKCGSRWARPAPAVPRSRWRAAGGAGWRPPGRRGPDRSPDPSGPGAAGCGARR